MRTRQLRRILIACLAAGLLTGCVRYYDQAKLDALPPAPEFVPAGEGATVTRLIPLLTGWSRSDGAHMFAGGDKDQEIVIPIPAFLIERNGTFSLVDTGMAPALADRPADYLGKTVACLAASKLRTLVMLPEWGVPARIESLGVDPRKVEQVIITHAHFDHTGANRAFLDARFVMTPATLDRGRHGGLFAGYWNEDFPEQMKVEPVDFAGTPPFLTFAGSRDLFGDGSVVLVPLPGHDPGELGVFVRTASGPVLLPGDAAYTMRNIREMILPGYLADPERAWDSLYRLNRLMVEAPEVTIVPSHDPDVYRVIPTAPESF